MKDFSVHADEMIDLAIATVFREQAGVELPPRLGRSLFGTIHGVLTRAGLPCEEHAKDAFSIFVIRVCDHLERHTAAGIQQPVHYLYRAASNCAKRYLTSLRSRRQGPDSVPLELDEESTVGDNAPVFSERQTLDLVIEALPLLSPRRRELILLDLVEQLSPEEIQARLKIEDNRYFRKLKCEAFKELRKVLLRISRLG